MIAELLSPHEELLDAVHEASLQYVEADNALKNFRAMFNPSAPESQARLDELKRIATGRSQILREAQTQLLLSNPSH